MSSGGSDTEKTTASVTTTAPSPPSASTGDLEYNNPASLDAREKAEKLGTYYYHYENTLSSPGNYGIFGPPPGSEFEGPLPSDGYKRQSGILYVQNVYQLFFGLFTLLYMVDLVVLISVVYTGLVPDVPLDSVYGILFFWNTFGVLVPVLSVLVCSQTKLPSWQAFLVGAYALGVLVGCLCLLIALASDAASANGPQSDPSNPGNDLLFCCLYHATISVCANKGPCPGVTSLSLNPNMVTALIVVSFLLVLEIIMFGMFFVILRSVHDEQDMFEDVSKSLIEKREKEIKEADEDMWYPSRDYVLEGSVLYFKTPLRMTALSEQDLMGERQRPLRYEEREGRSRARSSKFAERGGYRFGSRSRSKDVKSSRRTKKSSINNSGESAGSWIGGKVKFVIREAWVIGQRTTSKLKHYISAWIYNDSSNRGNDERDVLSVDPNSNFNVPSQHGQLTDDTVRSDSPGRREREGETAPSYSPQYFQLHQRHPPAVSMQLVEEPVIETFTSRPDFSNRSDASYSPPYPQLYQRPPNPYKKPLPQATPMKSNKLTPLGGSEYDQKFGDFDFL
jgi:hypothetical protein